MTSILKIVGGILALIGGALILIFIFISNAWNSFAAGWPYILLFMINIVLVILALAGGIMALSGKKAGGILALVAGIIMVLFEIIAYVTTPSLISIIMTQYSILYAVGIYIPYVTIEGILTLVGGILCLASGED